MKIPYYYDPVCQAERRAMEADRAAPICENCEEPIVEDYYWDIGGDLLCERCARLMYRKAMEDLDYGR